MSLSFTKPQRAKRRAKVLLIGDAGSGKTHAALTFPKPAVIDAEGSAGWFADRFAFEAVATKSYQDVTDLIRQMRERPGTYETLVIDSLTSIYTGLINAASAKREDLRPLDWGRIKRKYSQLLDELYHQLPMHVVCIGWIKPEYAKTGDVVAGETVAKNDLVKIGEVLDGDRKTMYAFDFVLRLYNEKGKYYATVLKSRSGALKQGQRIENFSWKTIEALVGTDDVPAGMTDDQQVARDQGVLDEVRAEPVKTPTDLLIDRARNAGAIPAGTRDQGFIALKNYAKSIDVEWGAGAAAKLADALVKLEAAKALADAGTEPDIFASPAIAASAQPALTGDYLPPPPTATVDPPMTAAQQRMLFALLKENGVTKDDDRHDFLELLCGKRSTKEMSVADAKRAIDRLQVPADAEPVPA